jgi:hypothetical protein
VSARQFENKSVVLNMVYGMVKGKGKFHPRTGHEGPEREWRYSCTFYLTSALNGVDCEHHAPAALPPGKTRYPLYRRLGGPQGQSGRVRKTLPLSGFDPRTVHGMYDIKY